MTATSRGSKHKLVSVREVTFGTTPATPAMLETPIMTFQPSVSQTLITSSQIRSHPFVDQIIQGALLTNLTITAELQKTNLDWLMELSAGAAFATGSAKVTDALLSNTIESQHTDIPLYDVYTGCVVNQMQLTFPAAANGVVTGQWGLIAKAATLDNATAITGETITGATSTPPFTFIEASVTLGGSSIPVTSGTFTLARQVDPLYLLGATAGAPDEYIPSTVTLTGQLTIPLRSNAQSSIFTGFTANSLVFSAAHPASGGSFTFTIPQVVLGKAARPIQNRGAILQTYDFTAKYDSSSSTAMTIAKT